MNHLRFEITRPLKGLLMLLFLVINTSVNSQIYDWAFNPSGTGNDRANSVKCDAAGNSYVVGQFFGTIDIDPGVGVTNLTSAGDRDFYVAKYDVSKNLVWAFKIGGATADVANGVTIDASGNVFVVGSFGNTVDFDPGTGTSNLTASGFDLNGFVAKYTSNGVFVSAFNVGFGGSSFVWDLGFDNSGNYLIAGNFSGTIDLNPGAGTNNVTSIGFNDDFVSRFSPTGVFLSGFMLDVTGGSASVRLNLSVLPLGDFYLAGSFAGTTDFDPAAAVFNLTAGGSDDGFLAKYSSGNALQWAFKIGGISYDDCRAVTADASGNVYVTGMFTNGVDFDPGTGTFNLISSQDDAYVAKYTSSGVFSWAFRIGGALSNETGTALAIDSNNDLYVTGYFLSTNVDFDPGVGAAFHSAANGIDIFVAKYSSTGNYIWSFSLADNAGAQPVSLAVNNSALYLTGYFTGITATIDCDPSAATANLTLVGGEDGIVAKYTHCISPNITSSPTSASICASSNTLFTISASGSSLNYQWQVNQGAGFSNITNGGVYSGATTATLNLTGPSVGMNTWQFRCVVSGLCAPTATSSAATLTVIATPTISGIISGSTAICAGASLSYNIAASSSATSYSWALPPGWTGSSTTNSINATANINAGTVSVSASNLCGTSSTSSLIVSTSSVPATPSSIAGTATVCSNTSLQYSIATVAGATSYSWSLNGGLSGSSTTNTIMVGTGSATNGILLATASNSCGTSPSQSLAVTVNPSPTITVNSGSICAGQTFTMVPSGANSYAFQGGSATVSPTSNTNYTVTGTSIDGCVSLTPAISNITVAATPTVLVNNGSICMGQSFTISPSGASTYTFSGGSAVVSPTASTSYSVSGTSSVGCVGVLPAISSITVNSLPTINISTTNSVLCIGQTATLNTSGANTYTWNTSAITSSIIISPTISTSYTVTGADSNGCVDSVSFVQTVSACTGIEDPAIINVVSLFPNPFSNVITIRTENGFSSIEIYNVVGELIYSSGTSIAETIAIDLSQHNNGIYFIRLYNTNRQFVNKKIIKQ